MTNSVTGGADEALERVDIAEKERGQAQAVGSVVAGVILVEVQDAGSTGVAGNAKVGGIANVGAKLDGVIALGAGPVVYKLDLTFSFDEGAVAAADIQPVSKSGESAVSAAVAALSKIEAGQTACISGTRYVQARKSKGGHRSLACVRVVG